MSTRRKDRRGRDRPPFVDMDFASALSRSSRGSSRSSAGKYEHRTLALCRQVQRVLTMAMAGECDDEVLRDAYIASVEPAPGPSRLVVRVVIGTEVGIADFLERVDRVAPRLRASVAQAITRKRAPELIFLPAAPEEASS